MRRCKGKKEKESHKYRSRIHPRGDIGINRVEGVEQGVVPIDPSLASISKGGGVSEDAGDGSMNGLTRYLSTLVISCSWMGLAYWGSANFYHRWYWSSG